MAAEKNKRKPGFQKGQSGNPAGRTPGTKNREKRLAIPDAIAALQLARKGLTPTAIAKALSARPAAVKDALGQARQLLEAFAPQVAQDWLEACRVAGAEGDHKPAMALLQSVKAVDPIAQTYDTGSKPGATATVNVQFVGFKFAGLPEQPTAPPGAPTAIAIAATTTQDA